MWMKESQNIQMLPQTNVILEPLYVTLLAHTDWNSSLTEVNIDLIQVLDQGYSSASQPRKTPPPPIISYLAP